MNLRINPELKISQPTLGKTEALQKRTVNYTDSLSSFSQNENTTGFKEKIKACFNSILQFFKNIFCYLCKKNKPEVSETTKEDDVKPSVSLNESTTKKGKKVRFVVPEEPLTKKAPVKKEKERSAKESLAEKFSEQNDPFLIAKDPDVEARFKKLSKKQQNEWQFGLTRFKERKDNIFSQDDQKKLIVYEKIFQLRPEEMDHQTVLELIEKSQIQDDLRKLLKEKFNKSPDDFLKKLPAEIRYLKYLSEHVELFALEGFLYKMLPSKVEAEAVFLHLSKQAREEFLEHYRAVNLKKDFTESELLQLIKKNPCHRSIRKACDHIWNLYSPEVTRLAKEIPNLARLKLKRVLHTVAGAQKFKKRFKI